MKVSVARTISDSPDTLEPNSFMSLTNFDQLLDAYANLAIKVGVNIQPGQRLLIRAPIESANFVRKMTECAYRAGSPLVSVLYSDDQLTLKRFENAPTGSFETFPEWEADAMVACAKRGDAFIKVAATDPDLLKDQNQDDVASAIRSAQRHMAEYMQYPMSDAVPWLVISVPVAPWATKVFPELDEASAIDRLWEAMFKACRVDQPNPVDAWRRHIAELKVRSDYLNAKAYDRLHYRGNGTNIVLGLPRGHIWKSGQSVAKSGVTFVANLPTEEVFTMGDRNRADGVVKSSKPLSYSGNIIDDFTLRFEKGRVVEATAKKGQDTLRKLVETDEGSARLGEIALVPHRSPISDSGILYYNTLFDENAASHLALGRAYRFNLKGGKEMTDAAFTEAGGNDSLVHVDFMIGNETLDIDGILKDGAVEPVMRAGAWAF